MLGKLIGKKEDKGFFLELKEEEGAAPAVVETPTPKAEAPKPKTAPKAVAKPAPQVVATPAPVVAPPTKEVMFETMPGRRSPGPSLDGFKAMARELQGRTMG